MTTNLEESAEAKRRIAVIGISTVILVAMVVAVTVGVSQVDGDEKNTKNTNHVASTVKAVKALCQPTDYKEECEESLTAEAGNTTDPRELIKIAFNVTINKIGDGLQKSHLLQEVENEPRAKMALDTCKQLMNLSISEFSRSLERIGQFNLNNLDEILTSLKVWLSGAVTYQETCLDGFENTTSKAGEKMKEALTNATKMSSNALSIITELANTFSELNETRQDSSHRRLKDEFPSWVDNGAGVRRLLLSSSRKLKPNVIVAKDGSAKFTSINQALKNVPQKNMKPFVIFIKKGVYKEYVEVTREMRHVVFVGEGGDKTRITGNKNFIDGTNTYKTATVAIQGDYFIAINMGFENSAGAHKHQAVAVRVQADKSIFYKCSFDGYQDTLYAHTMRQFYRDCTISGTIDFIFGDAVTVFQNCTFVVRKPMQNQQCIVTAQGRKEKHQPSGIVIHGGSIVAEPGESKDHKNVKFDSKAYLARPWKNYSRTVFLQTYIGDLIEPEGYMPWQGPEGNTGMDTCYYAEFNNIGPGSNATKRVKWHGVKHLTEKSVGAFFPSKFFHGDDWIRFTKVPYSPGLTNFTKHKI
ncbi:hypothetical protein HN51_054755 [Arachis hypogaea]|uniref:Pectinesterase n=1 Tax=Arachis hypogaea TaxID=3818 RepID=A0A444XKG5_ARAHY|nr:putative pectinesterase/pectinesterase inhibitor 28 [Arachis hypogaea]QHN77364.1 Putative pectinesterase/pectinesterase inhibitor [Arachis hypogaea]RYQ90169.1 hypothetical protein Ahy_B09g096419 [Arachis hypogaea]